MAEIIFPSIRFLKFLCKTKWSTKDVIGKINFPILFLSGEKDELVPVSMMKKLHNLSKTSTFVTFPQGTHMDLIYQKKYFDIFSNFINKL